MPLEFDEASHTYRLDGRVIPSVTQVLDALADFSRIPPATLEGARIRGEIVDEACSLLDADVLDWDTVPADYMPYVLGYRNWLEDTGAVIVGSQLRVCSAAFRYAGTLDILCELNGRMCLIDRKASHVAPPTVGPQTAAYKAAAQEMFDYKISRRHCLHLRPDYPRGYRLSLLNESSDYSIFISALNLHHWRAENL